MAKKEKELASLTKTNQRAEARLETTKTALAAEFDNTQKILAAKINTDATIYWLQVSPHALSLTNLF